MSRTIMILVKALHKLINGGVSMMKLNILNIQDFLDTINACRDEVYMICSNGQKVNIRGQYPIQDELHRQYYDHKNQLQIILEAQTPKDYMRIVSYYAGDC